MSTTPSPMPPARLTRAEAARLNGARSRGPVTPEGKQRSAMNAMKHGLTAASFALAEGEDGAAFQDLLDRLAARYRPADEVAAHLVQRLASVMWRQYRGDRIEAEVLTERDFKSSNLYAPKVWDAGRFNAVQRYQARLDRMLMALLAELDRCEPAPAEEDEASPADAVVPNEPEAASIERVPNEPKAPLPEPAKVLPPAPIPGGPQALERPIEAGSLYWPAPGSAGAADARALALRDGAAALPGGALAPSRAAGGSPCPSPFTS